MAELIPSHMFREAEQDNLARDLKWQLPRETLVEKLGEFRETYGKNAMATLSEAR